jgi:hypothetical protein
MTNKTIALIFIGLAWFCLGASILIGIPLFVIYSIAAIAMAHTVYGRQE